MRFFLLFAALIIVSCQLLASEVFWLRGSDETVIISNVRENSAFELGPNENSTKTLVSKTISSTPEIFAQFYHEPFGTDVNFQGTAELWISELETSDPVKLRFSVIDQDLENRTQIVIFQSDWQEFSGKKSLQHSAQQDLPYEFDFNHLLKISIELEGKAGTLVSMTLDEGSPDLQSSWTSPDGIERKLKGIKNSAAIFLEGSGFPSIRCTNSFDCSDLDVSTTDICYNPHTFRSFCSSEKPNCTISCSSQSDCNSGNCINAGTCASYCSEDFALTGTEIPNELNIQILQTSQSVYKKGSFVRISATASDKTGRKIFGAKLEGQTSGGISFPMREIDVGLYEGFFQIPNRTLTGSMKIRIIGKKEEKEGFDEITIRTIPPKITIDIQTEKTQPLLGQDKVTLVVTQRNFEIGEKIRFLLGAKYEDSEPVVTEKAFMTINGEPFVLKQIDKGKYLGEYTIRPSDEGILGVKVSIDDGFNNIQEETVQLTVRGASLLHLIAANATGITAVLFVIGICLGVGFILAEQKAKIALLHQKESSIIETIKEIQTKYFVKGILDKATYAKRMQELEPELKKIKEELKKVESYDVPKILQKQSSVK